MFVRFDHVASFIVFREGRRSPKEPYPRVPRSGRATQRLLQRLKSERSLTHSHALSIQQVLFIGTMEHYKLGNRSEKDHETS